MTSSSAIFDPGGFSSAFQMTLNQRLTSQFISNCFSSFGNYFFWTHTNLVTLCIWIIIISLWNFTGYLVYTEVILLWMVSHSYTGFQGDKNKIADKIIFNFFFTFNSLQWKSLSLQTMQANTTWTWCVWSLQLHHPPHMPVSVWCSISGGFFQRCLSSRSTLMHVWD